MLATAYAILSKRPQASSAYLFTFAIFFGVSVTTFGRCTESDSMMDLLSGLSLKLTVSASGHYTYEPH